MAMEHWAMKNEEEENRFERLPDDVVLNILEKVSDVKWLCRCFMASKRFSSLIPGVQALSFNSNIWDPFLKSCSDSHNDIQDPLGMALLGKVAKVFRDDVVFQPLRLFYDDPSPSFPRLNFLDLVFQLKQVRSLNLELVSGFDNDDSVFKWGTNFTTNLDSCTFIYAKSLSKIVESEQEEEDETEDEGPERFRRLELAIWCVSYAGWWLKVLSRVFMRFPMLESLTITDWKDKGVKLCLGGGKLVECRNRLCMSSTISSVCIMERWMQGKILDIIRDVYVPVLQLPISGYVMKGVTIVNFRMHGNDFEANTDMLDAFAEEKDLFLEAVVQIMKKHEDSINVLFQKHN